ncbi:MAG: HEPN domain-containing protein [Nocardiopsaceae bacterium]|nr:HEPN domain-containing protein [Nocardiopsaceae bacterium]
MSERNPPVDDLYWLHGAPATEFLLDRGQIERVEANPAHARTILAQARLHLSSARILATTEDAAAAFVTAYDAARKSLSAMLAVQGLRARGGDGGHRVLSELMQAQLPRHRRTLREFDWMRQKRNETQYPAPDKPVATAADVTDGIAGAQRIVELGEQFLEFVIAQRKTGQEL